MKFRLEIEHRSYLRTLKAHLPTGAYVVEQGTDAEPGIATLEIETEPDFLWEIISGIGAIEFMN